MLMASVFRSVARSYAPGARDQGAVPVRCCLPGPSADVSNLGQGQSLPRWPWCLRVCATLVCVRSSTVRGAVGGALRGAEQSQSSPGTTQHWVAVSCPSPWGGAVPWCWQRGRAVGQGPGAVPGPGLVSRAPAALSSVGTSRSPATEVQRSRSQTLLQGRAGGAAVPPGPSKEALQGKPTKPCSPCTSPASPWLGEPRC